MRIVVAVILVAFALIGLPNAKENSNGGEMSGIISSMTSQDAERFRQIYLSAARIVEDDGNSDSPVISSTDKLREFHVAVLRFLWNGDAGNSLSKYSGLRESIDKAFVDAVGDDARQLTPEVRSSAVAVFRSIGGQ